MYIYTELDSTALDHLATTLQPLFRPRPYFIKLLKQETLLKVFLLSRNEQDQTQIVHLAL